jgi:hypothetical protein
MEEIRFTRIDEALRFISDYVEIGGESRVDSGEGAEG